MLDALSVAARKSLESIMYPQNYQPKWPLLRTLLNTERGEGRVEGGIASLFRILETRGLDVSEMERERILATTLEPRSCILGNGGDV